MISLVTLLISVLACAFSRELHGTVLNRYRPDPFQASASANTKNAAFAGSIFSDPAKVGSSTDTSAFGSNGVVSAASGTSVDTETKAQPGLFGKGAVAEKTQSSSSVNQNGASAGFKTSQAGFATGIIGGSVTASSDNKADAVYVTPKSVSGATANVKTHATGDAVVTHTSGQVSAGSG